jgi:type IV pilus assembly protein PilV
MNSHRPIAVSKAPIRALGFTLVEVLVAVLVLAIGLLGLAGLQVTGLRNNQSAYHRSLATQLAYDISDRMRANAAGKDFYDNGAASEADCVAQSCTPQQIAENDLYEWSELVSGQLPQGEGVVCVDSTPRDATDPDDQGCDGAGKDSPACDGVGSVYAVKIWWNDDRGDDKDGNAGQVDRCFTTSFQP